MARYFIRVTKRGVTTRKVRKGVSFKGDVGKYMLRTEKKEGYILVTAKNRSEAIKKALPKGYEVVRVKKKK